MALVRKSSFSKAQGFVKPALVQLYGTSYQIVMCAANWLARQVGE